MNTLGFGDRSESFHVELYPWIDLIKRAQSYYKKPLRPTREFHLNYGEMVRSKPAEVFNVERLCGVQPHPRGGFVFVVEVAAHTISEIREFVCKLEQESAGHIPSALLDLLCEIIDPEPRAYLLQLLDKYARPSEGK